MGLIWQGLQFVYTLPHSWLLVHSWILCIMVTDFLLVKNARQVLIQWLIFSAPETAVSGESQREVIELSSVLQWSFSRVFHWHLLAFPIIRVGRVRLFISSVQKWNCFSSHTVSLWSARKLSRYLVKHCQATLLLCRFAKGIVCSQLFPDLKEEGLCLPALELVVVGS